MDEGIDDPVLLLDGQTTNVTGAAFSFNLTVQGEFIYRTVYIIGTFDGATVTVELTPDDGVNWIAIPDLTAIATAFMGNISVRADALRAVLANAGASTSITVGVV